MSTSEFDAVLSPATHAEGVPHALFDRMRVEAPVHLHGELGGQRVFSLTRFADIRDVSRDVERFSSARGTVYPNVRARWEGLNDDMAFSDPPRHTRLRSFAGRAFTPSVARKMRPWVQEVADEILDAASSLDTLDVVRDLSEQLPSRVITGLLGVPLSEREWVIGTSNTTFASSNPAVGPAGALQAREEILAYALTMRDLKLREPGDDMTTGLANASYRGEPITDNEFAQAFLALLSAGFETTHSLLTHSLIHFARHPDELDALRSADETAWADAVEELLRVYPPISHMARTVTGETEIGGTALSEGDYLITWFAAANRDPEAFDRPHQVDFERKPAHTTFGAGGPHLCLGNQLARLEARLMLTSFAQRGLALEITEEPTRSPNLFLNAVATAPARWKR